MRYMAQTLSELPTIRSSQFDDLKVETPTLKIWLSRMTVSDGASCENEVAIEVIRDGVWVEKTRYPGGVIVS